MKYLLTILMFSYPILSNAQLANGLYESDSLSACDNYFLLVQDKKVTLFGWEILITKDGKVERVYFRSSAESDTSTLTFLDYEWTKQVITRSNLLNFTANKNLSMRMPYRTLSIECILPDRIQVWGTKDFYFNKADRFGFKLIR